MITLLVGSIVEKIDSRFFRLKKLLKGRVVGVTEEREYVVYWDNGKVENRLRRELLLVIAPPLKFKTGTRVRFRNAAMSGLGGIEAIVKGPAADDDFHYKLTFDNNIHYGTCMAWEYELDFASGLERVLDEI